MSRNFMFYVSMSYVVTSCSLVLEQLSHYILSHTITILLLTVRNFDGPSFLRHAYSVDEYYIAIAIKSSIRKILSKRTRKIVSIYPVRRTFKMLWQDSDVSGVTRVFGARGRSNEVPPSPESRHVGLTPTVCFFYQIYRCSCAEPTITLQFYDFPLRVC